MAKAPSLDRILESPVSVLSNRAIIQLIESEKIMIEPFSAPSLTATAYKLCPYAIRYNMEDEEGLLQPDQIVRLHKGVSRAIKPGEYAVVSPRERISVTEGFIADFYPSSWCIENRLVFTAGRLDAGYKEDLVFGVYNAGRSDVELTSEFQLARVTFGWLGSQNLPVYSGRVPGAYIPELNKLRNREAALDAVEEDLRKQRQQLQAARKELLQREHGA